VGGDLFFGFWCKDSIHLCVNKRIIAVDFGLKRSGLAMSGPLLIAINPLETVHSSQLIDRLVGLAEEYEIGVIVFGDSRHKDEKLNKQAKELLGITRKLKKILKSDVEIDYEDESYTSIEAKDLLMASGVKQSKRREKNAIDQMSAVIILKRYLESKGL